MHTVVVLDEAPHGLSLAQALDQLGYHVLGRVERAAVLHDAVAQLQPELVVVATRRPSAATLDALESLAVSRPRPVIMFAHDSSRDVIRKAVDCGVAAYVVDGWAPQRLNAIIEAAIARFDAFAAMRKELASTRTKLAERKLIEKAKGIVMQQRGLSEDHAYSALRKMAMDQNLALAEVSRRVIAVSQLLA